MGQTKKGQNGQRGQTGQMSKKGQMGQIGQMGQMVQHGQWVRWSDESDRSDGSGYWFRQRFEYDHGCIWKRYSLTKLQDRWLVGLVVFSCFNIGLRLSKNIDSSQYSVYFVLCLKHLYYI